MKCDYDYDYDYTKNVINYNRKGETLEEANNVYTTSYQQLDCWKFGYIEYTHSVPIDLLNLVYIW